MLALPPDCRAPLAVMSFAAMIVFGVALVPVSVARADDLTDFEAARDAYEAQDFALAIQRFEDLVGGPVPRVRSQALRLESRKFLAASYLFVGRERDAEAQFRELLAEDPGYTLDPLAFPAAVQEAFARVRGQLDAEREAEAREREAREEAAAREELLRRAAEQERIRQLEELASVETVVQQNRRGMALLPFGVGQFRNGHRGFGLALAISQGVLLAGTMGTYLALVALRRDAVECQFMCSSVDPGDPNGPPTATELQFADRARRLRISNLMMGGVLGALYLVSVIDAQIRFVPERRRERRRDPDELPTGEPPSLSVSAGLGGGAISLRF